MNGPLRTLALFLTIALKTRFTETSLATGIVDFWHRFDWTAVSVVVAEDINFSVRDLLQRLCKESLAQVRVVGLSQAESIPRDADGVQTEMVTLLLGKQPELAKPKLLEVLERSTAFSILVVCEEGNCDCWKKGLKIPLGLFRIKFDNVGRSNVSKIVATRFEDGQGLSFLESAVLLPLSDVSGSYMHVITLPYEPYLFLGECEPVCKEASGLTFDILEAVALEANFTFTIRLEPSGDWGAAPDPINGSFNDSFGSVFGSVLDGSNDLPLSTWSRNPRRNFWADFTSPFGYDYFRCFADEREVSRDDFAVLLKPMTVPSWALSFLLIGAVVLGKDGLKAYHHTDDSNWFKMWMSVGGLACTVGTAYYSGAQTMFLASEPDLPFSSMLEGLTKATDWEFLVGAGDETFVIDALRNLAKNDPNALKKVAELKTALEENPMSSLEAIQTLNSDHSCLISPVARVRLELRGKKSSASNNRRLVSFCDPLVSPHAFLLPRSSPFKPALERGIASLRQRGTLKALAWRWGISSEWTEDSSAALKRSIGFGQVSSAFAFGAVVAAASLLLLLFERYSVWGRGGAHAAC